MTWLTAIVLLCKLDSHIHTSFLQVRLTPAPTSQVWECGTEVWVMYGCPSCDLYQQCFALEGSHLALSPLLYVNISPLSNTSWGIQNIFSFSLWSKVPHEHCLCCSDDYMLGNWHPGANIMMFEQTKIRHTCPLFHWDFGLSLPKANTLS